MTKTYYIYGNGPVTMALANPARTIKNLFVSDASSPFIKNSRNIKPIIKDRKFFTDAVGIVNHQNIIAEILPLPPQSYQDILAKESATILILDQVSDPHNVGAVIRSACAFGVDCIILPTDNSPTESATICKISAGAIEITPLIYVTNLVAFMKEAKTMGFWCYGMDGEAKQSVYKEDFAQKRIIVMGSEGKGIRKLVRENCDILIKIPSTGKIESLNISCAASIVLGYLYNITSI